MNHAVKRLAYLPYFTVQICTSSDIGIIKMREVNLVMYRDHESFFALIYVCMLHGIASFPGFPLRTSRFPPDFLGGGLGTRRDGIT